jgi:hypothetical protein
MRETLWDLRQIKHQREEMAREIEEIRLARRLRSKESRLRGLVAVLSGELRSCESSRECSGEVEIAVEARKEASPTTLG